MYPGISASKGYCNYLCGAGTNCPYTYSGLSGLSSIPSTFACNAGNYIQAYYNCITDSTYCDAVSLTSYSLYFNSFFTPANFYINSPIMPNLKSYIIEIWYFPDIAVAEDRFLNAPSSANFANYVFYSNSVRIYRTSSDYKLELAWNLSSPTIITGLINKAEWNKFTINIYYDSNSNYNLNFYVNNDMSSQPTISSTSTTSDQSLKTILFCHLDPSNCLGNTIYWASGLYRNLRIWDGEQAQPYTTTQFDSL